MKKKWRRWIGAVLCACCFSGAFVQRAEAEPAKMLFAGMPQGKSLSSTDLKAVKIGSAADLELLREDPDGSFVLTQDITVNGRSFRTFDTFRGTLDGQGHWIRGLRLNVEGEVTSGLFACIDQEAVVQNLGLEVSAVVTETLPTHIYGLTRTMNGKLVNCEIRSTVSGGTGYAPVYSGNGTIENCVLSTTADDVDRVSGCAWENSCELRSNRVELETQNCGTVYGLAYRNWEQVEGCTVSAQAQGIQTFYCTASQNYSPIRKCTFEAVLSPASGTRLQWYSVGHSGDGGSFDSSNVVRVEEGDASFSGGKTQGSGTQSEPYRLKSLEDLELLRSHPDASFVLDADIDGDGATFAAVGEFSGSLDGGGHTIRGLQFTFGKSETGTAAALIKNLKRGGVIENLTLECEMTAQKQEGTDAAGITICNEGTVRYCTVTVRAENCYALGGITRNNTGTGKIENCTVTLTAKNCRFVAGIAEYQSGTVKNCDASLYVTDATCLGGIAYANGGTIQNCTAMGTIQTIYSNGYLAGLVGENMSGGVVSSSRSTIYRKGTTEKLPPVGNE